MARGQVWIGTSGWHYRHWRGPFYPAALKQPEQLAFYAARFATVEINATFYRLIETGTLHRWRQDTPAGFRFACKASRYLTHMKRLKDAAAGLDRFFERIDALGDRLGPVIFQLPGRFQPERERLAAFLDGLPGGHRFAFEFRDPAWFEPAILDLLRAHNAAFCLYEFAGQHAPLEVTADFVYVRLHGPAGAYRGCYGEPALRAWAKRINRWRQQGRDVWCYFDNDERGFAPRNALRLQALLA